MAQRHALRRALGAGGEQHHSRVVRHAARDGAPAAQQSAQPVERAKVGADVLQVEHARVAPQLLGRRAERHLREALLAAAERAIAESSLPGLKARDVAREAGRALGAVYTAFADLDAPVLAVNARTLDALDAHLQAAAASRPEAEEPVSRVAALADAYLDYATRHRPRWATLFAHRMAAGRKQPGW